MTAPRSCRSRSPACSRASRALATVALGPDRSGRKRGVRDLVAVPEGLLILAGPMLDPDDGAVAAGEVARSAGYGTKVKPEAPVPLDVDTDGQRVLVFFD